MNILLALYLFILTNAFYLLIRNPLVCKCRCSIYDRMKEYNREELRRFAEGKITKEEIYFFDGHELPSYSKMLFSFKSLDPVNWLSEEHYNRLYEYQSNS